MQESFMNNKLYVGNISFETSETDLQTLFAQAGTVETVNIIRDRDTGRPRGFGFVEMTSEADAQNAIEQFNEQPFGGRNLTVNIAKPQLARSGGYAGGPRRSEQRW
jgi:RNA recognition motif-containing protein